MTARPEVGTGAGEGCRTCRRNAIDPGLTSRRRPDGPARCGSARAVQLGQAALRLLDLADVGAVRDDFLVQLDPTPAVELLAVVQPRGPQAGVVRRRDVPLEAALVI